MRVCACTPGIIKKFAIGENRSIVWNDKIVVRLAIETSQKRQELRLRQDMIDYLKGWDKENYRPLEVLDAKRGWALIACYRDSMIYDFDFDYNYEEMRNTCLYQYRRAIHRFKAMPEYPIPG